MKYFGLIFWFFILATSSVFSQQKYIKHTIAKGETISSIAEKYQVSQKVIFELNPNASGILKLKSILKIPNKKYQKEVAQKVIPTPKKQTKIIEHEVVAKETLFGIAKKYAVSVDEIKNNNPTIEKDGLKVGKKIKLILPENFELKKELALVGQDSVHQVGEKLTKVSKEDQNSTPPVLNTKTGQQHIVAASETKYGVSRKYKISVAELEQLNPIIANKSLVIGQTLNVPLQATTETIVENNYLPTKLDVNNISIAETIPNQPVAVTIPEVEVVTDNAVEETAIEHLVVAKETKFGIAKKYGITVSELEKLNPSIQNHLLVGTRLTINSPNAIASNENTQLGAELSTTESSKKYFGDFAVANNLIEKASDNLGVRYRSGGTSKAGFDCSGLMYTTFSAFDIKLPRSSIEQANVGLRIDPLEAQKGDLIFFKTRGSGRINHVGMVVDVEGDEIKFIHSSTSNGVIISSTKENYYNRNFAQVNRVLK